MAHFKIALPIETNQTRNKDVSDQRLLNMYAKQMPENSKESVSLYNTPGCHFIRRLSVLPVYGMHYMSPFLYVICGSKVFRVDNNYRAVTLGDIGTTNNIVRMADNGSQILAVKSDGDGYIITNSGVALVNSDNFPVASDVTFNSGYFVVTQKDSGRFYWSALLDGNSWSALAYATQESNPDNVVGIEENRGDLWIFGDKTTEIWTPSGNPNLPFQRIGSGILNVGCKSTYSIAKDKNGIYWLGSDLQVHFAQGYNETRISTHDIERELLEKYDINDVVNSYAFTYSAGGHDFYVLTIPNNKTWVFDMTTKVWHERKTKDMKTWLPDCLVNVFNKNIVGSINSGDLYELDNNYYYDDVSKFIDYEFKVVNEISEREIIFPPVFMEDNRLTMDKLYMDLTVAPTNDLSKNPQIMLCWSDDGGNTWSSEHWRSFGKTGTYKTRVIWRSLGQTRQRIYKLRVTDAVKVQISGLYCEGEQRYA